MSVQAENHSISPSFRYRWSEAEAGVCRLLRGWKPGAVGLPPSDQRAVWDAARVHRLDVALADAIGDRAGWHPDVRRELAARLREGALLDAARTRELARVLSALHDAGARPVVFKGAALSHQIYARPFLRPHGDADLLIARGDLPRARGALEACGYRLPNQVSGRFVVAQCQYVRRDRAGIEHALDVHWKPFNAPRFAGVLSIDEIAAAAEPLPALGLHARAASRLHQFLLVCVHRVAHHADVPDLLWIRDVHLLAGALGDELPDALALAGQRRVLAVCLRALAAAHMCFGTPLPADVRDLVSREELYARREGLDAYLAGERRLLDRAWRAFRAVPRWRDRLVFLREHLLPPPAYMRARYGVQGNAWLPALYLHRLGAGLPKWLRKN